MSFAVSREQKHFLKTFFKTKNREKIATCRETRGRFSFFFFFFNFFLTFLPYINFHVSFKLFILL